MRETWTDERLDDLKNEVRSMRAEMNERFEGIDHRFDGLHRLILQWAIAMTTGLFAMFAALIGLIATQL